jgi:hypothetical protein
MKMIKTITPQLHGDVSSFLQELIKATIAIAKIVFFIFLIDLIYLLLIVVN